MGAFCSKNGGSELSHKKGEVGKIGEGCSKKKEALLITLRKSTHRL